MTEISNNQEITLDSGVWDFLAISWDGTNKLTGNNRCAFSLETGLNSPNVNVNLILTSDNCLQAGALQKEVFGEIFQSTTPNAFKTLSIHTCDTINIAGTGCFASGTAPITNSVKVVVPLDSINDTAPNFFASSCYTTSVVTGNENSASTPIKLPGYTTLAGPTSPIITLHTSTDCTDTEPIIYRLNDGLFPHEDQLNGNFSLISDIDNSDPNIIKVFLEHNSLTSSEAVVLELVSSDLPTSSSDYTTITSLDIELENLYDNSTLKIYFNDATCTNNTDGLIGTVNLGASPLGLNTVGLSYSGSPLSGSAGNLSYFIKVETSGGSAHPFSGGSTCKLIKTVTDPTSPVAPSALSWSVSSPTNTVGIMAIWSLSGSSDVTEQEVRVYSDAGCSILDNSYPTSSSNTSQSITGVDASTYYFKVRASDLAGNTTSSPCSTAMEIDITIPLLPTSLTWLEVSPTNILSVNSQWNLSPSPDINTQEITYYSDSICTSVESSAFIGNTINTHNFIGSMDGIYYYTLELTDFAGNSAITNCSPTGIEIDTVAPIAATLTPGTLLGWVETSNVTFPTVSNSTWTPSSSGDLVSQEVRYYYQSDCATNTNLFSSAVLGPGVTTHSFAGADATAFRYKIISIDAAGNETESTCSDIMTHQ